MKIIKQAAASLLSEAIKEIFSATLPKEEILPLLEYPPDPAMGDLAFPCFKLSRLLRMAPPKIAEALVALPENDVFSSVTALGGYLNLTVNSETLARRILKTVKKEGDRYGAPKIGEGKTVVLDYSSPNVAKPFHIGHLGTTVIGHSLKLLHEFAGYRCVGINYLGDWGTQFGKLITAYRLWGNKETVEEREIDELVELYVRFHAAAEEDESLNDLARKEFAKLEAGDEENLALWRWFKEISLREYQKTYALLGIEFDSYAGESFYTDKMPAQIEILREKGLLEIDDGASVVNLEAYKMPPCLILKRDGSTLYPTRDIAAAVYRKGTYGFDKAIYVTSAGQCLHFAQWFRVVELMGYDWYDQLVHIPYGTVSLGGAKLATRTGNVVLLKDLFREAIEKVRSITAEKNTAESGSDDVAEAVGVGAVIFYYLSNNRMRDINFSLTDALSFEGNTGPYAQYTYARTCSLLAKGEETAAVPSMKELLPEETELIKVLARFPERVEEALLTYEPSEITRYIYELSSAFNRFYHECKILSADEEEVKSRRLAMTEATRTVLGRALHLICLKTPEKI